MVKGKKKTKGKSPLAAVSITTEIGESLSVHWTEIKKTGTQSEVNNLTMLKSPI
jgi:hypothetical protein